jgi:putative hydrolase of the HAD superfamily
MPIKAIIFDYVGTLVACKGYTMDESRLKLYRALVAEGFDLEQEKFLATYITAHEKYRKIRYEQFREVTNAVWVAEAMRNLGFSVSEQDERMLAALNVFFQDFIDTLELRTGAKPLLKQAQSECKIGLISNFTHAPVIYKSLRKVGIDGYFNAVVVSDANGWRKPSGEIFKDALSRLQVKADEAVYVGDSPIEDIKGAKDAGLKTVFVASQFNSLLDLHKSGSKPDYLASDLEAVGECLDLILAK